MKIFCCQHDIVWENKAANHAKVRMLLKAANIPQGALVLLPELFSTGFSMNVPGICEGPARETEEFLIELAQELNATVMGGAVVTGADGRGRNQALVFSPEGRELARYSKMQPFSLGGELQHYTPGEEIVTFAWGGFTVAPFICYDLRFPELFRAAARKGAHLITVIANWPVTRIQHWITLLQARAIENQAYVAGVNRCGTDPRYVYNGRSIIVNPHGDIIADAGNGESVIGADLDLAAVVKWRADFPALQDMRKGWAADPQK
ncbi:MAG TPA: carbon-nitrogen family hydrolase [Candidatus Saccharimonadales bacterium]|nr:carbon-nitrogen family hydrolase [Candidatus Saccharimonadales bacterium]